LKKIAVALFCTAALAASQASAAVVTYKFSVVIDNMFEYDGATSKITYVESSNMPGVLFSKGDVAEGYFSYSTDAPLGAYQPPAQDYGTYQMYNGVGTSQTNFGNGWTFTSNSDPWLSNAQVANNASSLYGYDLFSLTTASSWSPLSFQMTTLTMFDPSGTALTDSAIPASLDLLKFSYTNLDYAWLSQSDGSQMHASGKLTSLVLDTGPGQEVPAPSPIWTLVAGALAWMVAVRRARGA
jgi:hypothetical protein